MQLQGIFLFLSFPVKDNTTVSNLVNFCSLLSCSWHLFMEFEMEINKEKEASKMYACTQNGRFFLKAFHSSITQHFKFMKK